MRSRVQRASGIPCSLVWGETESPPGCLAPRDREAVSHLELSSPRRRGPSIPETPAIEPRSRGVRDNRMRGYEGSFRRPNDGPNPEINPLLTIHRAKFAQ